MFEKYLITPVMQLLNQILVKIGNPANPESTPNTLSSITYELLRSRVMRYTLYSGTSEYTATTTNYEVKKTFTTTIPKTSPTYTYILFEINFNHGVKPGSSKVEMGFGETPTSWLTLGEYSTTAANTFSEIYIIDPSEFENNPIIKLRISIKKNGTENFVYQLRTFGYNDVIYY